MSVVSEQIAPVSPGHRSEVRLKLSKHLNLTQVSEVAHIDLVNGNQMSPPEKRSDQNQWINLSDQVFQEELGKEAFRTALEKQRKIFKRACQEGSLVKDVGIYLKEEKMKTLTGPRALRMRLRRGQGQGMTGYAVFEKNKLFSEDGFFRPGRTLEVTGVHSNYPFAEDDATVCTRTLGLKFSAHPSESPFDLMFHTGDISPAFSGEAIEEFVASLNSEENRKKYLFNMPIYLQSHIESVRAAPSSYYHQHYYCHVTYDVLSPDGVPRPCRFRVVPADGSEESGRLTPEQQRNAWNVERSPTDNRPPTYLKDELRSRLQRGPLEYLLQVQIHDLPTQTPQEKLSHRCHMTYNQAIPWSGVYHPWETLATIKFTHELTEDATEIVRYHMGNLPSCLSLPGAETYTDFNLVPHILKNACDVVEKVMPAHPDKTKIPGDKTDYIVYAATANRPDSGNDANVSISIIGTETSTAYRKLHQVWRDDIIAGHKNTYIITDKIVGDILFIRLYLASPKGTVVANWRLDNLIVTTPFNGRCYTFPYYNWVKPRDVIILREGRGMLPSMERDSFQRLQRQLELQFRREKYNWRELPGNDPFYGLPGHLDVGSDTKALPVELTWENFQNVEVDWQNHMKTIWQSFVKLKKRVIEYLTFRKETVLQPYVRLIADIVEEFPGLEETMRTWNLDEEFGRQMLNGSNPAALRRLNELPEDFPIAAEELDPYVQDGTFTYELQVGRVYIATYPALEALLKKDDVLEDRQRIVSAPRVLLHVGEGQSAVLPLAIWLHPSEGVEAPPMVFTPSDATGGLFSTWQVAKLWVRCADIQLQLLDAFLLKTVLLLEPVTISLLRNISSVHPIYKLLFPHIRYVPAVATLWRKFLLPADGAFSQVLSVGENNKDMLDVLRQQYSSTRLSRMYLPEDLASRGTLDPSVLPNYFYRDDGLKVCGAIRDFVADIVSMYYRDDEEVALDEELQDFLHDLKKNGLPASDDLTDRFTTREELVRFLTVIIFQATAQHHAVTSGLVDDMCFVPGSPPCLFRPPPEVSSQAPPDDEQGLTDAQVHNLLPPPTLSATFVEMIKLIGRPKPGEKLGQFNERHFSEQAVAAAIKRFQTKLYEISESIRERNKNLQRPYNRLLPDDIPSALVA